MPFLRTLAIGACLKKHYVKSSVNHHIHPVMMAGIPAAAASQQSLPVSQKSIGSPQGSRRSMQTSTRRSMGGLSKRQRSQRGAGVSSIKRNASQKGMVLPFEQMNMAFHHIFYSVNLPSVRYETPCSNQAHNTIFRSGGTDTLHHCSALPDFPLYFLGLNQLLLAAFNSTEGPTDLTRHIECASWL